MSLTSLLALPHIRSRFKKDWPLPLPRPQSRDWQFVAPPISPRPSVIGTAFDYVLRFHLCKLNPLTEERERWVAESAVGKMSGRVRKVGQNICETARTRYTHFLDGEALNDEFLASCLQLAQLDSFFRAGYLPPSNEYLVFAEDIADLRQLVAVCDWSQWQAKECCYLNPTFGEGSHLVGGADADFQIDRTLFELKTVRNATGFSAHYHQLIGYTVLNFLNDGPPIDELAIYFSRFAQTVRWPAPRLSKKQYKPFLSWFCQAAEDEASFVSKVGKSVQPTFGMNKPDIDDGNYTELETVEGYFTPYCTGCDTTFLYSWTKYLGGSDSEAINCPNCGQELGMLETESKLLGQLKGDRSEDIIEILIPNRNDKFDSTA